MNKSMIKTILIAVILLFGLSACTPDEDESLKTKMVDTWLYLNDSATFSSGLLMNQSGQNQVIDTATLLSTVNSLFLNSALIYYANNTGAILKSFDTYIEDTTSLADMFTALEGQYTDSTFTFAVTSEKVVMTMDTTKCIFSDIQFENVSWLTLKVSMPLADLTKWMSVILEKKLPTIKDSPIYSRIALITAIATNYSNPTITLTFLKAPER
jgi:hypothetical protein